ncbi:hypothetical protein V3C99_017462 [Haemonchus contortus]|uniref:Uncharacterized protein n=1 Tax=Haemonchus contortus TaxID=6289 RepID=A0A7I4Z724_HAECO|nr:unnamed protein product [Haemonchus contortus]
MCFVQCFRRLFDRFFTNGADEKERSPLIAKDECCESHRYSALSPVDTATPMCADSRRSSLTSPYNGATGLNDTDYFWYDEMTDSPTELPKKAMNSSKRSEKPEEESPYPTSQESSQSPPWHSLCKNCSKYYMLSFPS